MKWYGKSIKYLSIKEKVASSDLVDAKDYLGHPKAEQGQTSALLLFLLSTFQMACAIEEGHLSLRSRLSKVDFAVPLGRPPPFVFQ